MTDVHCHVTGGEPEVREILIGRDFFGVHPWECLNGCLEPSCPLADVELWLREKFSHPALPLGVGEIGLDRLKEKIISPVMRSVFETQLKLAAELHCPVVLHGAKCWGEVISTIRKLLSSTIPAFLFHGFSRSDGLLPDIVSLNGYVSVGSAVLNDHAVNYRELVKKIPLERLLLETDRTPENAATCPSIFDVAAKVAELRGLSPDELELVTDQNATAFQKTSPNFF